MYEGPDRRRRRSPLHSAASRPAPGLSLAELAGQARIA